MAKIFISYARADRERVAWVVENLRLAGHDVFWDREIPVAADFERQLFDRINACQAVCVVWSAASVGSTWVAREVDEALEQGKLVSPIAIDTVLPPERYAHLNIAILGDWLGNPGYHEWKKVLASFSQLQGRRRTAPVAVVKALARELTVLSPNQLDESSQVTVRCKSSARFIEEKQALERSGFTPVRQEEEGLAVYEKRKRFNWLIAIGLTTLLVAPLFIYLRMYRRLPDVERVTLILMTTEAGQPAA